MNIDKFYEKLLKLEDPWYVDKVELNEKETKVDVFVKHHTPIQAACPECGDFKSIYDHGPERIFQHLSTCQMQTFVHVRLPRVNCDKHGIKQILSDLGGPNSHMTYAFESHVIKMAQECSYSAISRLALLSWDEVSGCVKRAVERGLSRKPKHITERIAVDEKSFAKGHKYETLVCDHDKGTVEFVADGNSQESLEAYYKQFEQHEKKIVSVITMDMWDPFIAATRLHIPGAAQKIVFDRFHVMKHMTEAVDKVRKEENQRFHEEGSDLLKGTKYLWLWNQENIPEWRKQEFERLQNADLDVSRAWAIKENLRHLWGYFSEAWARRFFKQWYFWATHSRLKPVKDAARTIKNHFENIVTYAHHRITNAVVEGLNSKIEKVKRLACGYRSRNNYRMAIYFHCGGLDLWPSPPSGRQIRWAPA